MIVQCWQPLYPSTEMPFRRLEARLLLPEEPFNASLSEIGGERSGRCRITRPGQRCVAAEQRLAGPVARLVQIRAKAARVPPEKRRSVEQRALLPGAPDRRRSQASPVHLPSESVVSPQLPIRYWPRAPSYAAFLPRQT